MLKLLVLFFASIIFSVFFVFASYSPAAHAQGQASSLDGLKVFSAVDLVGDIGFENPTKDTGRLRVRGFELATFGPVDPLFDALVSIAGHDEGGMTELELHEAYVSSSQLLSPLNSGLLIKLGQFFLGVGRLNRFHSHEWPFTSAPKSHARFFAEEAAIDTGIELEKTLDLGSEEWSMDVTTGLTNGWNYGHSHTGGRRPLSGTHYIRTAFFRDYQDGRGLMLGLNYLGRTDADSVQTRLAGVDVVFKSRLGKVLRSSFQMEAYHRIQSSKYLAHTEEAGGYFNYERSVSETGEWSLGARVDAFTNLSLTFAAGEARPNLDYAVLPYLTYRATEFSTLRGSYFYGVETRQGDEARVEQRVDLQLVVLFGAHPAHDF